MSKQFEVNDILCAKALYLYDNDTIFLIDENDEAYGFSKGSSEWYRKENFWDYFESETMLYYIRKISAEETMQLYCGWRDCSL